MARDWQPAAAGGSPVSQPQSDPRVDRDPLLAFSSEPGGVPLAPPQLEQPVDAPALSSPPRPDRPAADAAEMLRVRLDRLEKAFERSTKEIATLKIEVATLVGVAADIKKRTPARIQVKAPVNTTPSRRGRIVSAVAGIVLGLAFGAWFWVTTSTEPIAPAPPTSTESLAPAPVAAPPPAAPEIVPAAAVTPLRATPVRAAAVRASRPQTADYVGTLSIDSDPPGEVFIDRKSAGRTPILAPNLKAGSHLIWIERAGYRRFTRVVQVPADRVSRVVADLELAQR